MKSLSESLLRKNSATYFGASVFIHLGLLLYFVFSFSENSKTSLLPLGVEIVMESAHKVASTVQSATVAAPKVLRDENSDVATKVKPVEPQPVTPETASMPTTASSEALGQVGSGAAVSGLEGVQNGQDVSAEERFAYEIKKWFDRKKVYPQMAKAMGVSGTVVVEFTMNAAGEILKADIKKGTHPSLDQSALQLVKSIHGQKPFPQEIKKTTWTMSVPIEFSLR